MNKRYKILSLLLSLFFFNILIGIASEGEKKRKQQPNIIFIFADDLGYGDLGCYGHPYIKTPNIDKLAEEGTRFTRMYATGVTCSPSRTGFLTSRHPASYQKFMPFHGFSGRTTITELLHNNGYYVGHIGKWHISGDENPPHGTYGMDFIKVMGNAEEKTAGRDDDIFAEAELFLEQRSQSDQPFYLNIWGHISHFAVDPHERFSEEFNEVNVDASQFDKYYQKKLKKAQELGGDVNQSFRNYLGDVWSLDLAVGRLLKKLDDLGLTQNTIIVFSSDQGPAPVKMNKKKDPNVVANMLGWAGGLRGGKHEQFEGGVRIPFIVKYPNHVPEGHINTTSVLSGLDWLPTLCTITNTSFDVSQYEGKDVSEIWFGKEYTPKRYLYWKTNSPNGAVSILNQNWKAHYLKKQKKYVLFNLTQDAGETTDVAQDNPEVLKDLIEKVEAWNNTLPTSYLKGEKTK
ncbi:sulfatase [Flammeovirga sp. EKP202]|uniref:sulfatase family protein n=1 Tax=Flammeovirga sp. EKP202 TaxID=2770592 RepID=UPI00165EF38C|nr:sulfatase-like hydrolase/transferase [Flammeovirga sp. EKP202]MBD0405133.1 sulfatase-like hydrolase/transferase [Flammeovirga sp. EKP202]